MRKTIMNFSMILLLVASSLIFHQGSAAPDPEFDPGAGVDVPVWKVGDYWNYTTEVEYLYLDVFSITLSGWLNMTVVSVTLDMFSSGEPVYITNLTGNVSGEESFPFIGDVNIYIDLVGYFWNRAQDLSVYRSILNATVKGSVSSINGDYPLGYEYSPPMEEYDFPLIPGEEWNVNTSARLPFGASGDLVTMEQNLSCGDIQSLTVPAGTFDTYPVLADGSNYLFYNETVGRSVRRTFSLDDLVEGVEVPFDLSSYHREDYTVGVDLSIADEQHVEAGEIFTLHCEVSTSNVMVNIFFPGGRLAASKLLTLGERDFDQDLRAPTYPDNTPTDFDYGSFGIFATVNLLDGAGAVSVTTKARDLEARNGSLDIDLAGGGTIDDNITATMRVYNPSNFRVENFTVMFSLPGTGIPVTYFEDLTLDGRSSMDIRYNFTMDQPGDYISVMTIDPFDEIFEYNETNNEARYNFTVLERPDIYWNVTPPGGNYSMDEGESLDLYASATRGGGRLPGKWFLDGNMTGSSQELQFEAMFQGPNSSRNDPYLVRYVLDEDNTYPGEVTTIPYNITVIDVNRPHSLDSVSPSVQEVRVRENSSVRFEVNASDPDDDQLQYIWTVGNTTVRTGNNLTVETNFLGNLSHEHSPVTISVTISDGSDFDFNLTFDWTLSISDVDRPFSAVYYPAPGNISVEYGELVNISFFAEDPDGTPVMSEWRYLDNIIPMGNISTVSIDHLAEGVGGGESFTITLFLVSGNFNVTRSWNVDVGEEPIPPPPEPVPPVGVSIVSPSMNGRYLSNESLKLRAVDGDERNLSFVWTLDGNTYNGREVDIGPMEAGNHTAVLNVSSLDEGSPGWVEISVDFSVAEPDRIVVEPPTEDEGDDTSYGWIVILIVALIILMALLVVVMLFVRRRDEGYDEE